jgi:hypothetical protein
MPEATGLKHRKGNTLPPPAYEIQEPEEKPKERKQQVIRFEV